MRRLPVWVVLAALLCAAAAIVILLDREIPATDPVKSEAPIGENPGGRAHFEWLRLHDPATGQIPAGIRRSELQFAKALPTREFLAFRKEGAQQLDWISRGPTRIGGRTRALGIDRTDPSVINAGGVSGGMWYSEDGGQSWIKTTLPDQHHSVTTLIQDPRPGQSHVWYYGSGEFIGNSAQAPGAAYLGTGLYRSDDNGRTWEQVGFTRAEDEPGFNVTYDAFYNLAIDPSNAAETELYAATYGLLYRTTSDGVEREPLLVEDSPEPSFSAFTDVAVTNDGVVYAALSSEGAMGGLWRSTDGDEFFEITPPGFPPVFNRVVMDIAPSDENVVFFLGVTPGSGTSGHSLWRYTYRSGDGTGAGGDWADLSQNLPSTGQFSVAPNFPQDLGAFDSQGGYDLVIAVKPDDPNVIFIGGTNLYRSDDGFTSADEVFWIGGYHPTQFLYPQHHPDLHAIVFHPDDPNRMLTGDDGGIHLTTDNTSRLTQRTPVEWESLNTGYRTTQFYSVAIDESASNDNVIVGGMQDNGTAFTNDEAGTEPWVGDILGGDGAFADISNGKEFYYVSAQNAQIFRMELDVQGGVETVARVDPPGADFGEGLFVTPFHLDPNDQAVMYLGGGERIWRNEDLLAIPNDNQDETSINWEELTETGRAGAIVTAVTPTATSPNSTRLYFATINTFGGAAETQVFRLEDAQTGNGGPVDITQAASEEVDGMPAGAYVSSIAVHPNDPDVSMITFSNYNVRSVFYTEDAGATWSDVSGNLEENPDGSGNGPSVRWAEILPVEGGLMYFVATSTGVYSTTELAGEETVWLQEGASTIGNVVVDMLDSRQTDRLVVAATHGNGIYSAQATIDIGEPPDQIAAFELSPVYPNPFHPATRFTLQVAHEQDVEIDVFDELGRQVVSIHDGPISANQAHEFAFDGSGLASGVYIVRAQGEAALATVSAVLVK